MARTRCTITVLAVSASLLGACGSSEDAAAPTARTVQSTAALSPSAPDSTAEPGERPAMTPLYAHAFATVEEMAEVNVIFGRVVGAREGNESNRGEFNDVEREVRRIITVRVLDELSGSLPAEELDITTSGWVYVDGKKLPITFGGSEPFLDIGDEALMALDDHKPGNYNLASAAAIHPIRDGRIVGNPASAPELMRSLHGMTREQVKETFSKIAPT